MKKVFKVYALIWAILLALFNVICFVTPNEAAGMDKFGGAFWVGYIFITLAFVGQLICAYVVLNSDNSTKLFYNIPLFRISYVGLILTVIFGTLCMAIPDLPNWIGIIVCLLVLAFTALAAIKAKAAADIVENIDSKVKAATSFVKGMTVDVQNLANRSENAEIKASCKKVYDALRYSDPMSSGALSDVESRIKDEFGALTDAVLSEKSTEVNTISSELLTLIAERNSKCKLMK